MGRGVGFLFRRKQRNLANNFARLQVELSDGGAVPQRAPSSGAFAVRDDSVRECARNNLAASEFEALKHVTITGIDEYGIVSEVFGYEQPIARGALNDRAASRVRTDPAGRNVLRSVDVFAALRDWNDRQLEETIGGQCPGSEAIDCDSVAGAELLFGFGIGERA